MVCILGKSRRNGGFAEVYRLPRSVFRKLCGEVYEEVPAVARFKLCVALEVVVAENFVIVCIGNVAGGIIVEQIVCRVCGKLIVLAVLYVGIESAGNVVEEGVTFNRLCKVPFVVGKAEAYLNREGRLGKIAALHEYLVLHPAVVISAFRKVSRVYALDIEGINGVAAHGLRYGNISAEFLFGSSAAPVVFQVRSFHPNGNFCRRVGVERYGRSGRVALRRAVVRAVVIVVGGIVVHHKHVAFVRLFKLLVIEVIARIVFIKRHRFAVLVCERGSFAVCGVGYHVVRFGVCYNSLVLIGGVVIECRLGVCIGYVPLAHTVVIFVELIVIGVVLVERLVVFQRLGKFGGVIKVCPAARACVQNAVHNVIRPAGDRFRPVFGRVDYISFVVAVVEKLKVAV